MSHEENTTCLLSTEDADRYLERVSEFIRSARLNAQFPPAQWTRVSDTLILHGRRVCGPTPACDACHARTLCPSAVISARTPRPSAAPLAARPKAARAAKTAPAPAARRKVR